MPSIAPPPLALPRIASPGQSVFTAGGSFADYVRWFALDVHALRGRDVLDVAAGMSSFTAEACARKINAVAADPRYGASLEVLAAQLHLADASVSPPGVVPLTPYRNGLSASVDFAPNDPGAAAQRFLNDYEAHFIHNRYLRAALPHLPFFDGTFDVVVHVQRPFPPAVRFPFEGQLAATLELVRVSAGEVRLYLSGEVSGRTSSGLPRLRRALKEAGVASELRVCDATDEAGANPDPGSVLILRKATS